MKIAKVGPAASGIPLVFTCYHCGYTFNGYLGRKSEMYADMDGPAFLAYYCETCVKEVK